MENNQDSDLNDIPIDLDQIHEELEQKKEELIQEYELPSEVEKKSESNKEVGEIVGDLFYESVKSFFDMGFELAKNLNLEFFTEKKKKEDK